MEILLLSFLSVVLKAEWGLTDAQFGWVFGSVFAGAFWGTLALGRAGDVYGRKPVFVFTASTIAVFGVATAVCSSYGQLLACRFFVGFGVGGITVPFDTLAEMTTTSRRGKGLVRPSYFWTGATLLVPLLAWATLESSHRSSGSWRLFVALCAVPCVVSALVGLYAVPESPRWVLQHQRDPQRALDILREAARVNGKDPLLLFPPETQLQLLQPERQHHKASVWDLLVDPKWRKTTLLLWGLWGSYAFLYYGTVIAVTLAFFHENDDDNNQANSQQSYRFDYLPIVLSSSAEIAGVTLVLFTVDRFGRIGCLSAYFFLGGLSVWGLCLLEHLHSSSSGTSTTHTAKILLAIMARFWVYSGSNVVWILTAELLPTQLRTTGHGAANAVARVGAFAAPFVVQPQQSPLVVGTVMLVASWVCVGCARQLPETNGMPLEGEGATTTIQHQGRTRVPSGEESGLT